MTRAPATNDEPRKRAKSVDELMSIVMHPAFRIGFLDFRAGRPLDHDQIRARIEKETPAGALERLGFSPLSWEPGDIRHAQVRYEDGRKVAAQFDLRVKGWSHPDYPPVAVRRLIERLAQERSDA